MIRQKKRLFEKCKTDLFAVQSFDSHFALEGYLELSINLNKKWIIRTSFRGTSKEDCSKGPSSKFTPHLSNWVKIEVICDVFQGTVGYVWQRGIERLNFFTSQLENFILCFNKIIRFKDRWMEVCSGRYSKRCQHLLDAYWMGADGSWRTKLRSLNWTKFEYIIGQIVCSLEIFHPNQQVYKVSNHRTTFSTGPPFINEDFKWPDTSPLGLIFNDSATRTKFNISLIRSRLIKLLHSDPHINEH